MNERARRIGKLVELRQKELDDRVLELTEARAVQERAQRAADAAVDELRAAEEQKRELGRSGADARSFLEAEEWIVSLTIRKRRAWAKLSEAQGRTRDAQDRVVGAKNRVRQVELMAERIKQNERVIEVRAERRRDDEAAARLARRLS